MYSLLTVFSFLQCLMKARSSIAPTFLAVGSWTTSPLLWIMTSGLLSLISINCLRFFPSLPRNAWQRPVHLTLMILIFWRCIVSTIAFLFITFIDACLLLYLFFSLVQSWLLAMLRPSSQRVGKRREVRLTTLPSNRVSLSVLLLCLLLLLLLMLLRV